MQNRPSTLRRARLCALGLFLALLFGATIARANVGLVRFEAVAQTDTIKVEWVTSTEIGTIGFRLYRSDQPAPADWGGAIYEPRARGENIMGATYTYIDGVDGNAGNVQPGVRYYYLLEEVTSTGSTRFEDKVTSAGIGLAAATGTPTSTATNAASTTTATITPIVVGTATHTRTPVPTGRPTDAPAPTATRQFPNTETPAPTATLNAGLTFNSGLPTPALAATLPPTVIGSGSVTTPTPVGGIPLVQAANQAPLPTLTPSAALVALEATATPTALTAQLDPTASPTLILRSQGSITRTPQVFEPSNSASRRATPGAVSETRNASSGFLVGGGAIALAVLLGVGGIAFWQMRRH